MRWLKALLSKKVLTDKSSELSQFVQVLSTMSDEELAELVAYATHTRHLLERLGVNLLVPHDLYITHPEFLPGLIRRINAFQAQNNLTAAMAMMVWAHTVRATTPPDLKELGCAMWRELARGFPRVTLAAAAIAARTGTNLNVLGSSKVPFTLDAYVDYPKDDITDFAVIVRDNFHYMDESEQYESGRFKTYEEALVHSKQIVDDFLATSRKTGMTKEQLYRLYTSFGDDPFVSPDPGTQRFSAWAYAEMRCRQICDEEWWHD